MDNKSYEHLVIMNDATEAIRQYYDENNKILIEYLTSMIITMINQIKFSK